MTGLEISLWLIAMVATLVACVVSAVRPLNIFAESAREAFEFCRQRPRIAVFALAQFIWPALAPWAVLRITRQPFGVLPMLMLAQALSVALLAHVAFRVHRGLILGEWSNDVTFGRRELRMSAYVVGAWLAISVVRQLPVPAYPSLAFAEVERTLLIACAFGGKLALAVVGPAAANSD